MPPNSKKHGDSLADLAAVCSSTKRLDLAFNDHKVKVDAASIFTQFQRVVLTEQMRAADDPEHTNLVRAFDLSNDNAPLTKDRLKNIQRLLPELLKEDPEFEEAVIAVQSNVERMLFNRLQAVRFAKRHKEPIFCWLMQMNGMWEDNKPSATHSRDWFEAGAKELEFLFVRGLPVVLTANMTDPPWKFHKSWEAFKNRTGTLESFVYADEHHNTLPAEAKQPSGAGKMFTIPQPKYINVRLSLTKKEQRENREPQTFPMTWKSKQDPMKDFIKRTKVAKKHFNVSGKDNAKGKIPSVYEHPVQPFFACTYNKLQGATVKRIILVLHDISSFMKFLKMNVHKLYVGLSRVRRGCHLAIYPAEESELEYLTKLRYSSSLRQWYTNYDEDGKWKVDTVLLHSGIEKALEAI